MTQDPFDIIDNMPGSGGVSTETVVSRYPTGWVSTETVVARRPAKAGPKKAAALDKPGI